MYGIPRVMLVNVTFDPERLSASKLRPVMGTPRTENVVSGGGLLKFKVMLVPLEVIEVTAGGRGVESKRKRGVQKYSDRTFLQLHFVSITITKK